MRIRGVGLVVCLALAPLQACGGNAPPLHAEKPPIEAHWQDVFDTMPDLLVIVRAKAAREDRVYGPLLRRVLELSREQSKAVAGIPALEAMSNAEELILGLRQESGDAPAEMVLVARGVHADIDPGALVDDDGHALWTPGPAGGVRELARDRDEHGHAVDASLFELPGRTWVIAQGAARARAREAFAHPFNRPAMAFDPQALAILRFDGPSLVNHVRPLQDLGGLAAVGKHLRSLTLTLSPGVEHAVTASLSYADDDAAASAEVAARETMGALTRSGNPSYSWLSSSQIDHPPKLVVIRALLPPHLVNALLSAGSAPLDFDVPPPRR